MASYPWQPFSLYFGVRQTALHRRLPPWELMKILYEPSEDSASNTSSSFDSVDSDPPLKHKRRSYRLLLREIRRLRAENDGLRKMVDTIKQDLRFERESRQISERCHQKYYNESSDRQEALEVDVMDKEKEIQDLKQRLASLESTSPTPVLTKSASFSRWGCFDFDDDDELFCQPVMGESAAPDPLSIPRSDYCMSSSEEEEEDDDDDEDDGQSDDEKFEQLATSYLQQAILSKLTSARANLELDDLMLKYDPSPAVVLRMLASSFVIWVNNVVTPDSTNVVKQLANDVTEGFLSFWKAILEKHVHDDADQYQFLNEAERILDTHSLIVENFHRLLIMLYKYDIIDGDAITHWWHENTQDAVARRLRSVTQSFAQWLDEDEEDEDEDDDNMTDDMAEEDKDHHEDDDHEIELEISSDSDTVIDQGDTLSNLLEEDRQYCACQFEPTNTKTNHTTPSAHIQPPEQSGSCKCDITYTPPHTAEKKPKKTVRILL
ncbi:hypothetical protein BJV82DRAFT_590785 [Fennellomyces sp. T-0311]|nr:hypothetical protein BJV82DRAFT_590785 [Fennellomyces sp. T-0311]